MMHTHASPGPVRKHKSALKRCRILASERQPVGGVLASRSRVHIFCLSLLILLLKVFLQSSPEPPSGSAAAPLRHRSGTRRED